MQCEVQGVPLFYESYGSGIPILMLHGGRMDHHHMVKEFEPLFGGSSAWRRIYPDLPGHGRTPAPDWLSSHDQVLDLLLEFIASVTQGESFALAGASRGAYLARGVMHKQSSRVLGALLLCPARYLTPAAGSIPPRTALVRDDALRAELQADENGLFSLMVVQNREILQKAREYLLPAVARSNQSYQTRIAENYEFSFDVDMSQPKLDRPMLIVTGRQDSVVGFLDAWKMVQQFPRATFAALDRAGHLLGLEQEGLFRALASEWLQRVEESVASTRGDA